MAEKKTDRKPQKVIAKYKHNGYGIVSGPHNPASIGCNMYVLESGECGTFFTLKRWHQGHAGLAHGGIGAAILDEVLGYANDLLDYVKDRKYTPVFTGTVTYKYLKPVEVGKTYYAVGRVTREEGRKRFVYGEITDAAGALYVVADGVYLTAPALEDSNEKLAFQELTDEDPKEI